MEFCSIGIRLPDVENVALPSTRTLLDFDVVLIDPDGIQAAGNEHFRRRRDDIVELLSRGGVVVWFVHSGNLSSLLPLVGTCQPLSGAKVDVIQFAPFERFWSAAGGLLSYEAIIPQGIGTPTLFVSKTDKAVGSWAFVNSGLIILLPAITHEPSPEKRKEKLRTVVAAVRTLIEELKIKDNVVLPLWSADYNWKHHLDLQQQHARLERIARETEDELNKISIKIQTEEKLKLLFAAKGEPLVATVIHAFRELGATSERGQPGRDDVILEVDGSHAVIEVKGKKGSAAEKDAAQLEKWVAGFKETNDKDAKGILLVNAFCETPLDKRDQPAFPDQMLDYCKKREHCLMTTTHLLGMVLLSRKNPEKGKAFLERIFATVGIFDELLDHNSFLLRAETKQNIEAA